MAKSKFTPFAQRAPKRGTPEFERQYLLRMGYVRTPGEAAGATKALSVGLPLDGVPLDDLEATRVACVWLHPIFEKAEALGNVQVGVAASLERLGMHCHASLVVTEHPEAFGKGGMGAVAPMDTKVSGRN